MGRAAGHCAATAAEAEGNSQGGLSGPQAANGLRVEELRAFQGIASGNQFLARSVSPCLHRAILSTLSHSLVVSAPVF